MFVSERGIALITQTNETRMLTAEDYMKWYNLYIIETDGTVKGVEDDNEILFEGWYDHCVRPDTFKKLAESLNASYAEKTWKAVIDMYEEMTDSKWEE